MAIEKKKNPTEIKIPINGQEFTIKYDGHNYTVYRPDAEIHIGKYLSTINRALTAVIRESHGDEDSGEIMSLRQYVERYEKASQEVLSAVIDIQLSVSGRGARIPGKKKDPVAKVAAKTSPFDSL